MADLTRHARFDALFAVHRGPVFAYLLGRTGDRDRAADLLQETFVRVWRHLEDALAVPEDRQRFYLLRLAANVATDDGRRARTRAHLEAPFPEAFAQCVPPPSPESSAFSNAVDEAIRSLPEEMRTILTLQLVGGLTSPEIGEALGKPAGTIRSILHDARRNLERKLVAWNSEVPK